MTVPEVDKKILEELEAMGFPTARATRALHFSGEYKFYSSVNIILCRWIVKQYKYVSS